ncbi:ARM repeat-containing protein [Epithele typhae]|uniref:ARM repeat-containing protein n=1 Tax=Epithele typhae TaxID=378194 RepID=UPI00200769CF|nr:ARM repeat-containing protein [Epithele typhae]KAH9945789.1 ARM repeat-containing protein [Epithele typhae]
MTITTLDIPTLKAVKNSVIGNRTAKGSYGRDEAFVSRYDFPLKHCPRIKAEVSTTDVRIEAAHIIASLSYGSPDAFRTLLRVNALQALLYAVSAFGPSDSAALRGALARALRALSCAIADVVGPSQWGIAPSVSDMRAEAKAAVDYLFQPEVLDLYIPLLVDPSPQVDIAIAELLSSSVRDSCHRLKVSAWCPPAERKAEAKGKRGWEKRDPTKSPSRQGGWIARTLVALLQRKDVKVQEAALSALASIVKDNESLAARLSRSPPGQEPPLSTIMVLAKSRNTDLQLAAVLCATHVLRASSLTAMSHSSGRATSEEAIAITILHVLVRIIGSSTANNHARAKACFIVYHLVTDHMPFCELAFDRKTLHEVAHLINSITPTEKSTEAEEDEPESVSRLREAALTTVASISLFSTDIRNAVTDELQLIPAIQASLRHPSVGVRHAACQCARALSRGVSALRTNIIDTGLGMSVFTLFMKQDEDRHVMHAATAVVCNLINDFSPLRLTIIEQGAMERLVQLLDTEDPALRLDALWGFKNIVYKATPDLKRQVMMCIGWDNMKRLLVDEDPRLQEQAFHILRNLADGTEEVEAMLAEMGGSEVLLDLLVDAMDSEDDNVVLQAVFLLANVANYPAYQRHILLDNRILRQLRECLVDAKREIRLPAVSCVLELAPSGRQMGIEDDPQIQDKARQALSWIEQNTDMDV